MAGLINTGQLIAGDQIVDAIANYYDWSTLFNNSKTFSTMNVLGMVSAAVPSGTKGDGNYRIAFNKSTGMQTEYTTVANITPATGAINLKTLNSISTLNPQAAFTLLNVVPREGLAIRFIGIATDSSGAPIDVNALFRINTYTSAESWTVELLDTNQAGVDFTDACTALRSGGFVLLSDSANYKAGAPESDDMSTSQDYNFIQMYDVSYGKEFMSMSQLTMYDNGMPGLQKTIENRFYSQINGDILFGQIGAAPKAGSNYSSMKGIWGFMNLSNPALNTDTAKPTIFTQTGTAIDFWGLARLFGERGTTANDKMLCITTTKMSIKLLEAAHAMNQTVRTDMIEFPRMQMRKRSIMIGEVELILIIDDKLKYHPRFFDGSNAAAQEYVAICVDPRYIGLMYHNDTKLGTMIPGIRPIVQTRDARVEEAHMLSALTLGMWNMNQHIAFGLTNV